MGDTLRQFLWAVTAVIDIHEVRPHRIVTHLDASTSILGHQQLDFASSGDKLAVCSGTSFMIYTTTTWTGRNVDAACNGIVFTADGRELAVAQTVPKEHLDRPDFQYYDVNTLTSVRHLYTWASQANWSPTGASTDVRTWKNMCLLRLTKEDNAILVDDDPKNAFRTDSFALAPDSNIVALSGA